MNLKTIVLLFLVFFKVVLSNSQPIDNAYATFYGNTPKDHWTYFMKWNKVFNIQSFTDTTMVARYNKAADYVAAQGGGVLYFPAGTYIFEDAIRFRNGVVLRGETPIIIQAKNSAFSPTTRFEFPQYVPTFVGNGTPNSTAFKGISALPNVSNAGIVYVDINKGFVSLRSQTFKLDTTSRGITSNSIEQNRNLLIFGVRSNNVASPLASVPSINQKSWQRFCSPSISNLNIYAYENASISNCRINDFENNTTHPIVNLTYPQEGYLVERTVNSVLFIDSLKNRKAFFNYTDHNAISFNRKATISYATPDIEPGNFRTGLEIKDNWIFKTMRVGIICSGLGIVIDNNLITDKLNKQIFIHPNGIRSASNNAATYENRGIDWAGWNVKITNNNITVNRHLINTGPYYSVDGEGILMQECCGGTSINGAYITNNTTNNSYIGLWKVRDVKNVIIDSNNIGNESILILANTGGGNNKYNFYKSDNISVKGNVVKSINIDGNRGGSNVVVEDNIGLNNDDIIVPCYATVRNNSNFILNYTSVKDTISGGLSNVAPCLASSLPTMIDFFSPNKNDTSVQLNSSILLKATISQGSADSIVFFKNTLKIASFAGNNASLNVSFNNCTNGNKIHYYATAINTSKNILAISAIKSVKVICDSIISNTSNIIISNLDFNIIPNPCKNIIKLDNNIFTNITILNITGKTVLNHQKLDSQKVDVSHIPNGSYVLIATDIYGNRKIKKLIKLD